MTLQDHDYPWVFRRDEIDILEDELEDLYEVFHRQGEEPSVESAILREQLETEERSDQELSSRLGFDVLDAFPADVFSARESHAPPGDLIDTWQHDLDHLCSHPLYQKAKRWVATVKPFAKQGYEQGGGYTGELFRVYANANLVPLKIFTALCEEMHEDPVGWEIAQEEYHLALTYLERILDSLCLMSFAVELLDLVQTSRREAEALREELVTTLSNLSRRNPRPL